MPLNNTIDDDCSVVFLTCPSVDAARNIAHTLVKERLAASVTLIPEIASIYWLDGSVREVSGSKLLIKTRSSAFESINARVKELHSQTIPELFEVKIMRTTEEYRFWLFDETVGV